MGDGNTPNATGPYTWVPFTNASGAALPGALTITDVRGVTSVDARNTTNLPAFKGTDYQRPEDMQIRKVKGVEYLFMTTTTTNEVYVLNLETNTIRVFANRNTIDLATGLPVGPLSPARTTSRSTTKGTSTSSRTGPAASTTTSGSPTTGTATAT